MERRYIYIYIIVADWPGLEPATYWLQVRCPNYYTPYHATQNYKDEEKFVEFHTQICVFWFITRDAVGRIHALQSS